MKNREDTIMKNEDLVTLFKILLKYDLSGVQIRNVAGALLVDGERIHRGFDVGKPIHGIIDRCEIEEELEES